ncbi:hypothetical protein A3A39_04185 [Candidatus Kaiserbacteria bacterium RIFCSPLOWO2_01_FULL_54_13]|uniref:Uncharacterized protein n=1 Tax=Candidatus Kaiserbacteria bacterium RIFCSPLOWO2_01_FULL_54_13 TaxID=1798512 RepID=A0A1F6F3L8_9BACT|nr:MAG: hypothetical protein A3A39_04185 [Candidatus Kaiserbacteria bacterium RIFCSPLOWO2_01_FULL_54_13]
MELFLELSVLIAIATAVAAVMRLLQQPLIIGHILTGLIVGPLLLDLIHSAETLAVMGEIGVAILLFTVGLHLSPDIIRRFGKVSFITGIGQVLFTTVVGYFISISLGFSSLESFYIGVALAFSSTIIIMKLIADKGELDTLYAKIAVGFLLVQDLIAILLLVGIPLFSTSSFTATSIGSFLLTGIALMGFVVLASRFFISKVNRFIAQSQEFLFLFAIAWGIGVAALFKGFGLSLESGALVAGVTLAALPVRHEISARLVPLRDFFIVMFFILLGSQMQFVDIQSVLPAALTLSLLVLIGNPLILMILMGFLGYRKKTSFQTGLTVAQISEFSLILIAVGVSMGHLEAQILSLVTFIGLVTIFGCTYMVLYSERLYAVLAPFLGAFERKDAFEPRMRHSGHSVILFGCNRIGADFLESLKTLDKHFLVVDHDPDTVSMLANSGIAVEYGDAGDIDFLGSINVSKTELVISTVPDPETNLLINRSIRSRNPDAVIMVIAHRIGDALSHYEEGVDYVVLPHFLGGKYASDIVIRFGTDKAKYATLRTKHIEHLKLRIAAGHEHPYPSAMKL